MSARHRARQAVAKLTEHGDNWAYETWTDGKTAYFAFESERSAQLVTEALRHLFKSTRPQLIHNGRKPR
ncbi:hypothetical protein SEA_EVEPICKLES_46 [Arthrobacter phage EvePickles]|nr:hypothetical protein SEA_EVEPICKLES_46 [Arthrobacter phage EvePickles]